jgi:hypothetical protein
MTTATRATLTKQIEATVAQDDLETALALMGELPDLEDAACALHWQLGWADQSKLSGEWAERQYSHWRSDVMAPQLLRSVHGRSALATNSMTPQEQTLTRLLCNVQRYVTALKGLSTQESTPLPTPLRAEQESVTPGHRPLHPVPAPAERDEIDELYRWSQGSLLLLGAPGSGKTFKLMEIADELLAVVRSDPKAVIPLPLDLADWQPSTGDFAAWVVESANRAYLIERQTMYAWLAERRFAFLLDGLNGIADLGERSACVEAINEFLVRYDPPGLVVCSRPQEYADLPTRLALEVAVHVEPLDSAQIRAYLMGDRSLAPELQSALLADSDLAQLCETPLGLGVVRDAYAEGVLSLTDTLAPGSIAERRQHLIGAYIDRVLERADEATGEHAQTRHWLEWLASRLMDHQLNLLWFERIQPSWLPKGAWQDGYYALTRICFGLVAGILGGILIGLGLGATTENFLRGVVEGLTAAVAGGVAMAIIDSRWQNRFSGLLRQWQRSLLNVALIFCIVFLIAFVTFMLGLGPMWCPLFYPGEIECAIDYSLFASEAAAVASLAGLSFALVFGIESKEGPRSVTNDIQCGVVERLDLSRDRGLRFGLIGLGVGMVAGVIMTFVYWYWGSGGNPALELAVGLHELLGGAMPMMLLIPLIVATVCGLIGAAFGSITGMAIYPKSRKRADQPIWLLLKNASLIGLVGAILGIPLFWFLGTVAANTSVWTYGVFVGFLAFLGYGGLSLFLYVCLRGLLTLRRDTPPLNRYIPFLNAMSELRLLYRVQGGYRFFHPLWQEYFAGNPGAQAVTKQQE